MFLRVVESVMMPCDKCKAPTALMIVAPEANSARQLEDYAKMMSPNIQAMNVPTWVVGTEKEVLIDGELGGEALALKVWPRRGSAKIIYSTDLNAMFEKLMQRHC